MKVQCWEIGINVLCSLLEDTATGVLVIVDLTILSVVQICPERSNDVDGSMYWKHLRYVTTKWHSKGQVSIVVDLQTNTTIPTINKLVDTNSHCQSNVKYEYISMSPMPTYDLMK